MDYCERGEIPYIFIVNKLNLNIMNDKLIQIGGKSYKQCEVVMLPTEKASKILRTPTGLQYSDIPMIKREHLSPQHLYILSSEEIKEGEDLIKDAWYINTFRGFGKPFQNDNLSNNGYLKQIIATTDESLKIKGEDCKIRTGKNVEYYPTEIYLPRPSDDFLKAFVKANGKGFDKVLVEYEPFQNMEIYKKNPNNKKDWVGENGSVYNDYKLKVSSDNTVTIRAFEKEKRSIDDVHKECLNYLLTQIEKPADPMNNLVSFNAAQMALNLMVSEIKLGRVKI